MENLQAQIEERINEMVGDVLVLIRRAANDAVNNALSGTTAPGGAKAAPKRGKRRASQPQARRSPEELSALCERLYQKIDEDPGKGMAAYAEALSTAVRDLGVVMKRLRKAGRVRTLGERDRMQYFPMDPS
jgi:hypothetical protein